MKRYDNDPSSRPFNETKVYGLVQLVGIAIVVATITLVVVAVAK